MTVSSTNVQTIANGNGVATVFSYQFKIEHQTDLVVQTIDTAGVVKTLVLNTDYTVDPLGVGLDVGGNITYSPSAGPLATGWKLVMTRIMALAQSTDLRNQGTYLPENVEDALDNLLLIEQQLDFRQQRTLRAPDTDAVLPVLPSAASRATKYLTFDANGNPLPVALSTSAVTIKSVQTITALRLVAGTADGDAIVLDGISAEGDIGSGTFYWNSASVAADNGTSIIQATGITAGRWIRVPSVPTIVQSIAALKLLPGLIDGQPVIVSGYYAEGDGGGGEFFWNATSTTADNGGTIIAPTGVLTGRWYRIYSDAVNVKWFGAKGDGVTDDTAAVQAAIDANKGATIVIPSGSTCLLAGILLSGSSYNNTRIIVSGTIKLKADGSSTNFGGAWVGVIVQSCDGVEINGSFNGNRSAMIANEHIYCVGLAGASHFKSQFLEFSEVRGDGIYIGQSNWVSSSTNSSDVELGTIYAHNSADDGRNALTIIACSRLSLGTLYSYQIGGVINGITEPGGFDIEPDFAYQGATDILIGNMFIVTAGTSGLQITGKAITNDATRDWNTARISIGYFNIKQTNSAALVSVTRAADVHIVGEMSSGSGFSMDYLDRVVADLKTYNTVFIGTVGPVGYIDTFDIKLFTKTYTSSSYGLLVRGASHGRFRGRIGGAAALSTPIDLNKQGVAYTQVNVIYSIDCPYDGGAGQALANTGAGAMTTTNCAIQDCDFSGYSVFPAINDTTMIRSNVRGVTDGVSSTPITTSGTTYQNTSLMWITLLVPVTFTPTAGAVATCAVALGSSSSPSTISTETVPAGTALDSFIRTIPLRVPPNWYYKFTVTNATIGTVTQIAG